MQVMRLTGLDDRQFYNADMCAGLVAETVNRMGGCKRIDLLEMTEQEYYAIPATNEAAELWRLPMTFAHMSNSSEEMK